MKIEHIAIWAEDIEKLKAFYTTYFKAKPGNKYFNRKKGFSSYFLTFETGARLEIMQMPSIPKTRNDPYRQFTGFIHLAISVGSKENVDSLTARLAGAGHEVVDGLRTTGDGYYESVVLDPEHNRIEITV
ncbi:glyoxalase/bleomycin resistance/extradiol dioxygenase family protein [Exilibacterium tricleocarpae]|uniref:Glyoxalase/bleomycin resistance/extradiol dioxygenase family protein n=1 Tax=Exilibacterium tricleocarpae TaxID=2591008 RepID=A0A545TS38_9GAMM|nr:VOC family protein [Exilibacterium tricleocarpae]TQV80040.1 glyoxalase/bleomycin resistance/extradiol dioxygenase family protein [Exilibacterium tricleocarpae]